MNNDPVVIIGAGPAGLTAAYELTKLAVPAMVLEQDDTVGGISRTVEYKGYRCDIGGHRFFTKVRLVQDMWEELLPDDLLEKPRLSRVYYNGRFFDYPLNLSNAFTNLGMIEAARVAGSYLKCRVSPAGEEKNFEQWVSNRFGRRLFDIFFRTYTEKVWGIPCSEISADWARQRIKNLDFVTALKNALLGSQSHGNRAITSLIDRFHYPRLGPGMMWERCRDVIAERGVETRLGAEVVRVSHRNGEVTNVTVRDREGKERLETGRAFFSSMPMKTLLNCLDPAPPEDVMAAAARLRYRDFLTVMLIVNDPDLFDDNWIYVHAPEVKVGRIQNFKNWSPYMAPDQSMTSLGLEYFVQQGDSLWNMEDDELVRLGAKECAELGLLSTDKVVDGTVIRMPKAYPVYDGDYHDSVSTIRSWLETLPNLHLIGRNGQHRYNNQDHSMVTGLHAAWRVHGQDVDVWDVNVDEEYHEELEPEAARLRTALTDDIVRNVFARYDPVALGISLGLIGATVLLLASVTLLIRGGSPVGPTLSLLANYLPGYRVTWTGAFKGAVQLGLGGYLFGYLLAGAANCLIRWHESVFQREVEAMRTLV